MAVVIVLFAAAIAFATMGGNGGSYVKTTDEASGAPAVTDPGVTDSAPPTSRAATTPTTHASTPTTVDINEGQGDAHPLPNNATCGCTPTTVPPPQTLPAAVVAEMTAPGNATAVIDVAHAQKLANDVVPLRDRALLDSDEDTLKQVDTGAALSADISNCGCPGLSIGAANGGLDGLPRAISLVPRQTSYPASFVTEALVSGPDGTEYRDYYVFVRPDAATPWKIARETATPVGASPDIVDGGSLDAQGFDVVPQSPRIAPASLIAQLAAQYQHQKVDGSGIPNGPFAADEGSASAVYRQDQVNDANGLRGHFTYTADPNDRVYAYGFTGGSTFVCGVVHIDVVWTPGPDIQPYQDPAREDWGKTLPTGFYKKLVEHRIVQPCIVLPTSASVQAQVFEGDEAYLLVVGTPA